MKIRAKYLSLVGAALMVAGPLAMAADAANSYNANTENNGVADLSADWLCGNGSGNTITYITDPWGTRIEIIQRAPLGPEVKS